MEELDRSKYKYIQIISFLFKLDYIFIVGQKMFSCRSIKQNSPIVDKLHRVEVFPFSKYRLPPMYKFQTTLYKTERKNLMSTKNEFTSIKLTTNSSILS